MPSGLWITVEMTQDNWSESGWLITKSPPDTKSSCCVLSPGQLKDGWARPILNVKCSSPFCFQAWRPSGWNSLLPGVYQKPVTIAALLHRGSRICIHTPSVGTEVGALPSRLRTLEPLPHTSREGKCSLSFPVGEPESDWCAKSPFSLQGVESNPGNW